MTTLLIIFAFAVSPFLSALAILHVHKRLLARKSKPPAKTQGADHD